MKIVLYYVIVIFYVKAFLYDCANWCEGALYMIGVFCDGDHEEFLFFKKFFT